MKGGELLALEKAALSSLTILTGLLLLGIVMPAPALQSRWGFAVLLLSAVYGSTPREQCASLGVLYAVEDSNGVKIVSAMEGNKKHEIAELRNHSLPSAECEPNFDNCMLQCFKCSDEEETVCCTLPVVNETGGNHLAMLQFRQQSDVELPPLQLQDQAVLSQDSDCVTAQVFFTGTPKELPVACINTKVNESYIWFLQLVYESTNISGTARFEFPKEFQTLHLTNPLSLSEFLSLERSECHVPAIFFVANSAVYTIIQQDDGLTFQEPLVSIPDCFLPLDIGDMHMGQLHLRLQCSEYIAKLFTACGSQEVVEIFDSRNKTVYQCVSTMGNTANVTLQNDLLNVTVSGSPQEFEGVIPSQYFPFMENISYAFCNVGRNVSFVFALRNGSVSSLSLTTGKLVSLSHNSCNSSTNTYARGQCYKTRNTTILNVIGAYDFEDSTFKIANLSCPNNPVVANIEMDSLPPLVAIVKLPGGVCTCPSSGDDPITSKSYLPTSEASLSPTNSYTVSTTPVVSASPTKNNLIETLTTPTAVPRPTANSKHNKWFWALLALTLLVLPVLLLLYYKNRIIKKCKNTTKQNTHVLLNDLNPAPLQSHSPKKGSPPASLPDPRESPKSKPPTHPDGISQPLHVADKDPSNSQPPQATDDISQPPHVADKDPSTPQATNDISQPPHVADKDPSTPQATNDISQPPYVADKDPSTPQATNDISQPPYVADKEPVKIVPQQPQATNQQDRSNLTYTSPSLPNHFNGTPLLPSGNPGVLLPATTNNHIQQEHSGLSLPYPSGQEVTASGEQETQGPANNINAALVPGTEPQRQAAAVVPQGQGAPGLPLSSSSSPDPFTGERQRGH